MPTLDNRRDYNLGGAQCNWRRRLQATRTRLSTYVLAKSMPDTLLNSDLTRIADALERLAPPPPPPPDFSAADAFVWNPMPAPTGRFEPVHRVARVPLAVLQGIDRQMEQLLDNTRRFAQGLPANNALLWGARGTGKSSIVKAIHAELLENPASNEATPARLKLIEVHREDINSLPAALAHLRASDVRALLFCDDLSFDHDDTAYKSLKAVLDGGIEGRPDNVLFYATSNRRHLLPRDMIENERSTAINPAEAVEEKVSLSDRFGLWLGFHNCNQRDYLAMVHAYVAHFGLRIDAEALEAQAKEWSVTRGARSGRVAWQFIQDLAGRLGQRLD